MASNKSHMCGCTTCDVVRSRLSNIFSVLDTYRWVLDTYIVDFFEDDVWQKLPNKWRETLEETSPRELGNWMAEVQSSGRVWPLSLMALKKSIETLEINRDYKTGQVLKCRGYEKRKIDESCNEQSNNLSHGVKRKCLDENYQKIFMKSVKKKKRHEIEKIAETTSECSSKSMCECIVDIGAGMGHLARALAYNYGLCVVCLEQNESLTDQAIIRDESLYAELCKKIPSLNERNPRHISTKITESDSENMELVTRLKNEFSKNFKLDPTKNGFGLIGLHTCGDLAATLLRFYTEQVDTRFICMVGCCYMKITCGQKETASFGYPLSEFVSAAKNHEFSYAALEVACHAIENYTDKLITGNYQDSLVHAYRATLETVLVRKNGKKIRRSHLKNVKLKNDMTFQGYCKKAIENLNREDQPEPEDFKTAEVTKCLNRWREVIAFGTLRFMLAPLVETAVLFDRFLYLSENNLAPSLQPIFDPRISPRNIVLTSCK